MQVLQNFLRKPFIRHNLIYFVGASIVSALNYLYYPILSRLLRPSDFGEVQALVSLFTQAAIFFSVLGMVTVNIVTNAEDDKKRNDLIFELEKLAFYISFAGLLLTVVFAVPLQHFLNFESSIPIIVTYFALLIGVPITFRGSFLRGQKDFMSVSISNILASFAKLVFSAALVYLGFRTVGAIGGLVVAQIITLIYTGIRAKQLGLGGFLKSKPTFPDVRLLAPELKYGLLVLAVSLSTTVTFSIDVIAVKHYFAPHTAGLYAGISTVARIIFYLAGPVVVVMLSFVKIKNSARDNFRILLASLAISMTLGGTALVTFFLIPTQVVKLLIGQQYSQYASLLPSLSLVMMLLSLNSLIYSYFLALRRYAVGFLAPTGIILTILLLNFHHGSLPNIIEALLLSSSVMLLLVPAWLIVLQARKLFSRS